MTRAHGLVAIIPTLLCSGAAIAQDDFGDVPGVVVAHIPASTGNYIGSPALARLPDGALVASHDLFGKGPEANTILVYRSEDEGATWSQVARFPGFWSNLFVHRGELYIMGVSGQYGSMVIRRSTDGGHMWTDPVDSESGLLLDDAKYHTAPMPMVVHEGRLWRAFEDAESPGKWGEHFRAFIISAPVDADLLQADSWTKTNVVASDLDWLDGDFGGWLEGNAVLTPHDEIVNILRVELPNQPELAAVMTLNAETQELSFDPETGFVELPGGAKKFSIKYDEETGFYWSIVNHVPKEYADGHPGKTRNTVALVRSPDLKSWTVRRIIYQHPETKVHGYQYWDWIFDGDDILGLCRTAHDDELGGAHNYHDANFLTFHRIESFRE